MRNCRFAIAGEKDKQGYFAYCPELRSRYAQEDTFGEVTCNIKGITKLHVEDILANNEPVTTSKVASLSSTEVTT